MSKYLKSEDCLIHLQEEEGIPHHYLLSRSQGSVLQVNATIIDFVRLLETPRSLAELMDCIDEEMGPEEQEQIEGFIKALYQLGLVRKEEDPPAAEWGYRFQPGDQIGPYSIVEGLSIRRWTQLYKVQREEKGPFFVLKLFNYDPKEQGTDLIQQMQERFYEEFKVMSQLQHPNVCAFYEFHSEDHLYGVIEYIEGLQLRDYLENTKTLAEAELLIEQLLEAFAYLHEQEILHGDIHYLNVLINQQRQLKVIDFGFSYEQERLGEKDAWHAGLSHFIPPERVANHSFRLSKGMGGTRAEVFQLGILMYYILAKNYPFEGELWEDLREAICNQELSAVPSVYTKQLSPSREATILKALAKDPEARFEHAGALLEAWAKHN